jgi:hypothetical protein
MIYCVGMLLEKGLAMLSDFGRWEGFEEPEERVLTRKVSYFLVLLAVGE